MDTKRIKGLQVITHAGDRVGTVDQVFFDPATKHVPAPPGASTGVDLNALVSMDELAKRQVVTESGVRLGQIAGIEFDPQTLRLARIEVSAGFFKSNKAIAAEQVTSFGSSAIMVADAVVPN